MKRMYQRGFYRTGGVAQRRAVDFICENPRFQRNLRYPRANF
jgi:hypothetical protein